MDLGPKTDTFDVVSRALRVRGYGELSLRDLAGGSDRGDVAVRTEAPAVTLRQLGVSETLSGCIEDRSIADAAGEDAL